MADIPRTIVEAAQWLRSGRISSAALTEVLLGLAHAAQGTLAAFNVLTDEPARAAARRADADFAAGVDRGPLQGIPLGIKDIIATTDAPTTANSRVLDPAWGAGHDATVVRKLREAGAVLMGKLGLHEFAIGWPDPATGFSIPKNPWDMSRSPGGSSSGTGAAVAGGLVLGGLGTDTGGSIRGPAAYCGISGLKATFGRVSKQGCVPLGYSLDHIGPMAHTARDCAILLDILAGYDPADPCAANVAVPDMQALMNMSGDAAGLRIGVPRDYFFTVPQLDPEIEAAVLVAVGLLESAGAVVQDVTIPHAAEALIAQRVVMLSEAYAYHEPDLQARPELYGAYTRRALQQGALYSAADYVQAQRVRSLVNQECAAALAGMSVLVVPTGITTAPTFAEWDPDSTFTNPSFTSIWNLTGLPALSVPCGFSSAGLPIGMQIVGKPFEEPRVLAVGDAYQRLADWHTRVPGGDPVVEASTV